MTLPTTDSDNEVYQAYTAWGKRLAEQEQTVEVAGEESARQEAWRNYNTHLRTCGLTKPCAEMQSYVAMILLNG